MKLRQKFKGSQGISHKGMFGFQKHLQPLLFLYQLHYMRSRPPKGTCIRSSLCQYGPLHGSWRWVGRKVPFNGQCSKIFAHCLHSQFDKIRGKATILMGLCCETVRQRKIDNTSSSHFKNLYLATEVYMLLHKLKEETGLWRQCDANRPWPKGFIYLHVRIQKVATVCPPNEKEEINISLLKVSWWNFLTNYQNTFISYNQTKMKFSEINVPQTGSEQVYFIIFTIFQISMKSFV